MNGERWFCLVLLWQWWLMQPYSFLQVQGSVCQTQAPKWSCCRRDIRGCLSDLPSPASPAGVQAWARGSAAQCSCTAVLFLPSLNPVLQWRSHWSFMKDIPKFPVCSCKYQLLLLFTLSFFPTVVYMLSHCSYLSLLAMAPGQNWGLLLPLCSMLYKYMLYKHQLG